MRGSIKQSGGHGGGIIMAAADGEMAIMAASR